MKKKAKKIKAAIFIVLLIIAGFLAVVTSALNANGKYIAAYKQYCPANCPNTLWTCTEGNIYFASDENGKTLGAVKKDGELTYYGISFDWRSRGFDIWELETISYPDIEVCPFRFRGKVSYFDDSCSLRYGASTDEDHYFGERERGEVTLTFIKSDLTAPFSFQSEESLNELPFR